MKGHLMEMLLKIFLTFVVHQVLAMTDVAGYQV